MIRVVISQGIYGPAAQRLAQANISYEHHQGQAGLPNDVYAGGGQCGGFFDGRTAVDGRKS